MDEVHNDDSNLQKETKSNLLSISHNFLALIYIFCVYEAVFQYLIASNVFHYSCRNSSREILAEFWPKHSLRKQSQST